MGTYTVRISFIIMIHSTPMRQRRIVINYLRNQSISSMLRMALFVDLNILGRKRKISVVIGDSVLIDDLLMVHGYTQLLPMLDCTITITTPLKYWKVIMPRNTVNSMMMEPPSTQNFTIIIFLSNGKNKLNSAKTKLINRISIV